MKHLCALLPVRYFNSSCKHLAKMACTKFGYVRKFETSETCLLNCWPVVRIDGKNFHKFADLHQFRKPNDDRALKLMSKAAERVMQTLADIVIAYGQSDEYSFVFKKSSETYNRRTSKLSSVVVSQFASSFVFHWNDFFADVKMIYPPAFDSRVIVYPSDDNLRDYLSWRQADCHINNLYNTCFWALVHSGMSHHDAQLKLKGTVSSDKNEILFSQFDTNYNDLPQLYRKGTVLVKDKNTSIEHGNRDSAFEPKEKTTKRKLIQSSKIISLNVDIIGNEFWETHPHILQS